ncbi:MAG: sigma-70 family RNA polymerase sigma factor [Hyphomicrobiales bacterium]
MGFALQQPGQRDEELDENGIASDALLLRRIRSGDKGAFEQVAVSYFQPAWRVAARVLRDDTEAEDVVQDVFLKIWRDPPDIDRSGSLKAWIIRVTTNASIDRIRKKRPMPVEELPERIDPAADAESGLQAGQAAEHVRTAMEELPERQRLALILTYYEGLANKEAAEILEVSVDALESLLARARRALRTSMDEVWQDVLGELERVSAADGQW